MHRDRAATAAAPAVQPHAKAVTAPRVQGRRAEAAADASRMYADSIRAAGSSLAAVGAALDVDPSAVAHWADPDLPAAVTLRDLLAGPRSVREAVAHALLSLDAPAVEAVAGTLAITVAVGALASDAADATAPGSVSGEALSGGELARLRADVARVERACDSMLRGLR